MKEWLEFIKSVRPLKKTNVTTTLAKKTPTKKQNEIYVSVGSSANGIDGSTKKKFIQEKFKIEKTLDLHGYTYDNAFDVVINFIKRAYLNQLRCVLIITGKGQVLKDALPKWLENNEVKNLILEKKHPSNALGGSGAYMLLIRRKRSL